MPGRLPENPNFRQRRNKPKSMAILPAEVSPRQRRPRLPKLPNDETWDEIVLQIWDAIWQSPLRHQIYGVDESSLIRLMFLYQKF